MVRKKLLQWAIIVVIIGLAAGAIVSQSHKKSVVNQPSDPNMAADFRLPSLDGSKLSLADYRDKGVVLNFWGTFCQPCRTEMPALEQEYEKYKDQGIVVIGINVNEPKDTVTDYVQKLGIRFPIALDTGLEVTDAYHAQEIPHSVFIKPGGTIAKVSIGQMNAQQIDQYMQAILPQG